MQLCNLYTLTSVCTSSKKTFIKVTRDQNELLILITGNTRHRSMQLVPTNNNQAMTCEIYHPLHLITISSVIQLLLNCVSQSFWLLCFHTLLQPSVLEQSEKTKPKFYRRLSWWESHIHSPSSYVICSNSTILQPTTTEALLHHPGVLQRKWCSLTS